LQEQIPTFEVVSRLGELQSLQPQNPVSGVQGFYKPLTGFKAKVVRKNLSVVQGTISNG